MEEELRQEGLERKKRLPEVRMRGERRNYDKGRREGGRDKREKERR